MSVKTFLYLCCIFITHCHVLDYFQCNHVSVAMRRGSERDNYDHVYSVNEQRGPIVYYASGNRYEGTWMDDKKNGQGVYYFASGNRYEGTWMDDNMNGQGVHYYADGDRYEGTWIDGNRNGQGVHYYADGSQEEIFYVNGVETSWVATCSTPRCMLM